ncbi:hypothetical protein EJ08DRAFT_116738 [Tothia fuscella]|uniref:DUF7907 domain-containing protein n=1 Tax=Tothia fuscella TaxID=1048955 RepID=A0A9P4U0V2_9PEZI|nr:hypothetical protein EJ08DRAFT_116738 [Tothia fuscella]
MLSSISILCSLFFATSCASLSIPLPFSHAPNFKLVVKVTGSDLSPSIQNWELTSYQITPCQDYAVLQAASENDGGRPFYANGTASEIRCRQPNILTDGGTPPFPYGLIVPPLDETNSLGRACCSIRLRCWY